MKRDSIIIRVGRGSFNDIVVDDDSVLMEHCNIVREKNGLRVININKFSKTFVNNVEINWEADITPDDELRVGAKVVSWQDIFSSEKKQSEEHKTIPKKVVVEKQRNGFVTFWLWLSIIANALSIPYVIIYLSRIINFLYVQPQYAPLKDYDTTTLVEVMQNHVHVSQFLVAIAGALTIVFLVMLLHWKKAGFWGFACTTIIFNIIVVVLNKVLVHTCLSYGVSLYLVNTTSLYLILPILQIAVMRAVLQIKKNGVSCWKHLE